MSCGLKEHEVLHVTSVNEREVVSAASASKRRSSSVIHANKSFTIEYEVALTLENVGRT